MSSPYLIFLEVALVALALWLHSVLFSLVTFIVLSYFTPKYMYDKTNLLLKYFFKTGLILNTVPILVPEQS